MLALDMTRQESRRGSLAQNIGERRRIALSEVLEQIAPASVVADTAVEVLVIRRRLFFQAVSFASRQNIREAASKVVGDRKVISSQMRMKWSRYCRKLREDVLAKTTRMQKALNGFRMPTKLKDMPAPAIPGSGDPHSLGIIERDEDRLDENGSGHESLVKQLTSSVRRQPFVVRK